MKEIDYRAGERVEIDCTHLVGATVGACAACIAKAIAAAEERGRRRGVEELRTLATTKAKEAEDAAHVEGWHGDAQMQAYHAGRRTAYASIIDAALAPRDSGKWDNAEFLEQHYESRGHSAEEARRMARGEPEPKARK